MVPIALPRPIRLLRVIAAIASAWPVVGSAQTLSVTDDIQARATLINTAVTLGGKAELHITGTGDPIPGCTINLTSVDSWLFMSNVAPSTVVSTMLSRIRVNGAGAVVDSNVRVAQYAQGAVVIPHAPGFAPMTIYDGRALTGPSRSLSQYTGYGGVELGSLNNAISSFRLKRGYTATIAEHEGGDGMSRNYVAADGDLEVSALPDELNNSVSFVRVFPWRWVSKKGSCDVNPDLLNADWYYNWSISSNSTRDWEYVAIKQQRWWPELDEDWRARGVNHLLGFNEPNNPVEDAYESLDNGSTTTAVAVWPELLSTGLRVGAPAVTDGGYDWIVDFMNKADAAGMRVDYVPVHYYRSYWNKNDAAGAANQLYNFLKSIHDATGRPIWLTEFNNGANWTDNNHDPDVTQNRNAIEAMIDRMDDTWWVERYSVYSRVEWFRQTHYDDGAITPMGAMYRDHVAPLGYVQQMPSAELAAAAHYSFDGDLRDALMNGNDGMAVGAPAFTPGRYGQAISLDGSTDYVQLAEPLGDSTDFTFTGWLNWNGGAAWQRIFDFGNGGTDNYVFLTPRSGSDTLRFGIRMGGVDQQVETTTLPAVGTWTHVAVTISNSTAKLFVNGDLMATRTGFTFDPGALRTRFNYLGKSQWPDPLFSGKLDDLRFLTTALSDAQIAAIAESGPPRFGSPVYIASAVKLQPFTGSMAAEASGGTGTRTFTKAAGPAWLAVAANGALTGVPGQSDGGANRFLIRVSDSIGALSTATLEVSVAEAAGLVARYPFDGNAAASVGALDGLATGSPVYGGGRSGQAIDLDGTNDFVTLPAGIANTDAITIAAWTNWDGGAASQRLFDFGNGTAGFMRLSPRSSANTLRFTIDTAGAPAQELNAGALTAGEWTHVAVALGGGTGRLYVNGTLVDSDAITLKPADIAPASNFIGRGQSSSDPPFAGRVDEFLIFNQALTAAQIGELVNGRAPVFGSDPLGLPIATAGQVYEETIAGAATDPDAGGVLSFTKVSGPGWLTVSPDGRLSGVPDASDAGTNRFVVRVTDQTLLADDATLNIIVGNPVGLIAHHQFNDSTADAIGGATGITTSGSPAYAAGIFDRAISLDGTNDFVQLRPNLLNGVTDLTIAARVRWDGGGDWQRIFDFGNGTNQYLFLCPKVGSISRFAIKNGSGTEQRLDGPALIAGDWAHVAVTLIGNTGTFYLNGAVVATGGITIDPATFAPTTHYLGKSQFAADPLLDGRIDDFRIYNRGLSAAEIAAQAVPAAAVAVSDSGYAAWAGGHPFPDGQSGALADADEDGLSNAWEYFTGSDPLLASSGTLPSAEVRTALSLGFGDINKTYVAIQVRILKRHLGATLVAEAAATLAGLAQPDAASHAVLAGAPVTDGDFELRTYYFDTAIEDSPTGTGFIRLRMSWP